MKDHQFAHLLAVASAHIGLSLSAFLLFVSITVVGVQAQTYAMQYMGLQVAAVAQASTTPSPDSKRKQDLSILAAALDAYHTKHGTYVVAGAGAGGGGQGVVTNDGLPTYKTIVQGLIADGVLSTSTSLYATSSDYYLLYTCGQSYALSAKLDNPTTANIAHIQTTCNGTGGNGTYTLYKRNYAVTQDSPDKWPLIYGQAGSYYVSKIQNLVDMNALGMNLMIYLPGGLPLNQYPAHNAKAITTDLADMTFLTLCPNWVCSVTPERRASVLTQAQTYLNSVANDPTIVGFWLLDDYPGGNIRSVLEEVRALVVESNKTSVVKRPTICGVGYPLTLKGSQTSKDLTDTLSNVSPAACDMVGLYSYGHPSTSPDPSQFNWSMSELLPNVFAQLRANGWDPQTRPFLAIPQAFGISGDYVTPRAADIAEQSAAYCNAGASALIAFSWDTSSVGAGGGLTQAVEPYNNADIKRGLADGVQRCKAIWDARLSNPSAFVSQIKDLKRKQDVYVISNALRAYHAKHGTYVVAGAGAGGGGQGVVTNDGLPTYKTIVQGLIADGVLSPNIPIPSVPGDYYLLYTCGNNFAVSAKLDNPTSAEIAYIQTTCNGTGGNGTYTLYKRNYAVTATGTPPLPVLTKDEKRKQDLQMLKTALNAYYAAHGTYNVAGAGAGGGGNGVVTNDGLPTYKTIVQGLIDGGFLSASVALYAAPADYYLLYVCGNNFALSAKLDSPSAADISTIQASCNGTGGNGTYTLYGRNYAVTGTSGN